MKSHVLLEDADIYLINFPPKLTQWAHIQNARMNNAGLKTALLQRMSSSHTVNTNKLPKVLKSRTPVVPPSPSLYFRLEGDAGSPCFVPAKSLTWGKPRRVGGRDRPRCPRVKDNTWGFHSHLDSADLKPMFYHYLLLLR